MISLSLSPTTTCTLASRFGLKIIIRSVGCRELTSPSVHPVDSHWRLERVGIRLELLERIGSTSRIGDNGACLGGTEVFQDVAQLVAGGRGLLNICSMSTSANVILSFWNPGILSTYQDQTLSFPTCSAWCDRWPGPQWLWRPRWQPSASGVCGRASKPGSRAGGRG